MSGSQKDSERVVVTGVAVEQNTGARHNGIIGVYRRKLEGVWVCFLFALAATLERLTRRPSLATRWGALLAVCLGGRRLQNHLYVVPRLPAVGFRAAAQTWGETVLVTKDLLERDHARTLAHEACHVAQYRRLTSLGFLLLYLAQWLRGLVTTRNAFRAYWEIPLEHEARRAETRYE